MGKIVEAERLRRRTRYDLELLREVGYCSGIENYSRYFDGRNPGDPPYTLIDHFRENAKRFGDGSFLTVIDESHITVPQVRGMYNGDQSRKKTLVDYGFRLPSALDNRPLRFEEFMRNVDDMLFVSATPNEWEVSVSDHHVVEQLIRPTGLLDPEIEIRKSDGQIENLVLEILKRKKRGERVLVTTLTKRMAEALTEYLNDPKKVKDRIGAFPFEMPKVQYLHSDIETLERSDILDDLRRGVFDVVIGINLLREGLDLPEVSLVAILDADKEGFLRSTTSLIQTMGRAARHQNGRVIMYANTITKSMKSAIDEVNRRREVQIRYNEKHHVTPMSIQKPVRDQMIARVKDEGATYTAIHRHIMVKLSPKKSVVLQDIHPEALTPEEKRAHIRALTRTMNAAAKVMNFELAAEVRDTIKKIQS